jgi:hypothetical protein
MGRRRRTGQRGEVGVLIPFLLKFENMAKSTDKPSASPRGVTGKTGTPLQEILDDIRGEGS